jgi:hypothetical protein
LTRLVFLVLLACAACGHATVARRTPDEATFYLRPKRDPALKSALKDAEEQMGAHCNGRGFTVVEERSGQGSMFAEHEITYRCKAQRSE